MPANTPARLQSEGNLAWLDLEMTGLDAERDVIVQAALIITDRELRPLEEFACDVWQPPALLLWGRHDAFFEVEETVAWMRALPRMEAHIMDGGHFLLETHAEECARLMGNFIRRTPRP